jgi:hypothetical protein
MKAAVVPAYDVEGWRHVMEDSLMGSVAVRACWRYLGVFVASRAERALGDGEDGWSHDMKALIIDRNWARHIRNIIDRALAVVERAGSPGHRAAAWNIYMASCIPFPAQLCVPGAHERKEMQRCLSRVLRLAGWCPSYVSVGIALRWHTRRPAMPGMRGGGGGDYCLAAR